MTKKVIQGMTNEDLIFELSRLILSGGNRFLKSSIKEAKVICEELQKRGIVEDAEALHERWVKRYQL